jgi:hypothetical protein
VISPRGFEVLEGALTPAQVEAGRAEVARLAASEPEERREAHRALGSLISIERSPLFLGWAGFSWTKRFFAARGFEAPRFTGGYLFDKPPGCGASFWHQDWYFWDEPESAAEAPPQLGLLFYLSDATVETGCLKVLPRSQHQRLLQHDLLAASDKRALRRGEGPPELFATAAGEVHVPVRAGDAVALDARLLHAANANRGPKPRPLVTFWYVPDEARLSGRIRAAFGNPAAPSPELEEWMLRYPGSEPPAQTSERGPKA